MTALALPPGRVIYDGSELPAVNSQVRRGTIALPDVRILSCDPGETCGFAEFARSAGRSVVTLWEIPADLDRNPLVLWWFLQRRKLPTVLLIEQFIVLPGKIAVNTSALQVIGILKLWCGLHNIPFYETQPSMIQGNGALVNEDFQRSLNLWGVGLVHANDALRHIISHLIIERREKDWLRARLQEGQSQST